MADEAGVPKMILSASRPIRCRSEVLCGRCGLPSMPDAAQPTYHLRRSARPRASGSIGEPPVWRWGRAAEHARKAGQLRRSACAGLYCQQAGQGRERQTVQARTRSLASPHGSDSPAQRHEAGVPMEKATVDKWRSCCSLQRRKSRGFLVETGSHRRRMISAWALVAQRRRQVMRWPRPG